MSDSKPNEGDAAFFKNDREAARSRARAEQITAVKGGWIPMSRRKVLPVQTKPIRVDPEQAKARAARIQALIDHGAQDDQA